MESLYVSAGYFWSCSRDTVLAEALKINDLMFLKGEIDHNKDLHWRKYVLAEAIVVILKREGMKAQELVKTFIKICGQGNLDYLYSVKGLSKKSIDTMIKKGVLVVTSHSRLREDDREMVYWKEVNLA